MPKCNKLEKREYQFTSLFASIHMKQRRKPNGNLCSFTFLKTHENNTNHSVAMLLPCHIHVIVYALFDIGFLQVSI
jgi:hypothetical protein